MPEGYYSALGRLVAISSLAETQLALCGWAAETGYAYTDEWAFDRYPGGATKYARKRVRYLDTDQRSDLRHLLATYAELVGVRHQAVHGVLLLDPTLTPDEQWLVQSARHGVAALTVLLDAMEDATVRLHGFVRSANQLRNAIAARPSAARRRQEKPLREAESALITLMSKRRETPNDEAQLVAHDPASTVPTVPAGPAADGPLNALEP
ncbi:hypothetical protein [Cellulomonas fengjieae]|uniref:Uncharacterized protein n=1 Tax=Cellulomonas fengjieae TaxID=2819978 RepID=A0ABS3SB80_9CELL|nr:hypothetical protein [Cellulomonas fengjieae]MBO3083020.1 hypothetical protein [Cellulomonas fengjieae]QVI65609.1 hypothetical protein KG102_16170 [Cellulomonas fengjieae]